MRSQKSKIKKIPRPAIRHTCPQRQQPARQRLGAATCPLVPRMAGGWRDGVVLRGGRAQYAIRCGRGFTIVELLVAFGLFSIVIGITSGAFVRALQLERATVRLMAANDAAALTLEQMAREIRVGSNFSNGASGELHFTNALGQEVWYARENDVIEKRVGEGPSLALTSNTVRVSRLQFIVSGAGVGDGRQPRVTIALAVAATGRFIEGVETALQTTVTPRILETE